MTEFGFECQGIFRGAQVSLQVDIGFGDAVSPSPVHIVFPTLLDLPAPRLKAYPIETVIAEKFEALVVLGIQNSRMKDFFDLWTIARTTRITGATLTQAMRATFETRQTQIPADVPLGLSSEFAADEVKRTQWRAFLRKNSIANMPDLSAVLGLLRQFLLYPIEAVHQNRPFTISWSPGGPWQASER